MRWSENARLSFSSCETLNQCGRLWWYKYEKGYPEPSGPEAELGTHAHSVLESFYSGTGSRAKETLRTFTSESFDDFAEGFQTQFPSFRPNIADLKQDVWNAVEGIFYLENPAEARVLAVEQKFDLEFGGLPLRGFIDRVDEVGDKVAIIDIKTGKVPQIKYTNAKLMQLYLYAYAMQRMGTETHQARLYYTTHREIIQVAIDQDVIERAEAYLQKSVDKLQEYYLNDDFPTKTGPLCGWCHFVDQCPAGEATVYRFADSGRLRRDAPAFAKLAAKAENSQESSDFDGDPFENLV